ncbi:MAG: exodeoxyribonuclease V subunit gamma, partial [Desulfatitalea sp.]|nr:exodeoxyribonuclease V subunit gamma [Desulfatitalea sp.]
PADDATAHPLQPEQVMVQSKGMQRWISMAVARINGICANVAFPFPNALMEQLYGLRVGPLPPANAFDPRQLTFHILHLLPELLDQPVFSPLRRYLADDHRPLKRYQLARKIADMLDQYSVFRPDMLMAWEAAGQATEDDASPEAWQRLLWRRLVAALPGTHRSTMQRLLVQALADPRTPIDGLPPRLSVFGISYLPPFHLQVLEVLARRIPVFLFLMNPCRHYWSDILSDHQMIRRRVTGRSGASNPPAADQAVAESDLHLERGNRLLASLGHMGKPFFDFIQQYQAQASEVFQAPPNSLLGCIQQDILDLVDRSADVDAGQSHPPASSPTNPADDRSLRIHSCHSPMREVEVLYDQLLDMLSQDPSLEPRDVLVMTPDIGLYAPYVHAVFGAARGGDQARIPYTVTDQSILLESPLVESYVRLLDLVGSRFEASRVMALLACTAVHRRFGLCEADLPLVEKWIREAHIRWGWDGADRRRHHLPAFGENTWRIGLDRLVLGYAMGDAPNRLFAGIPPYDGIGPGEERVMGAFVQLVETLRDTVDRMPARDTMAGWHPRLMGILERFFDTDAATARDLDGLNAAIAPLAQLTGLAEATFDFEVVRQYVRDALGRTTFAAGFMAGGVTFCAMLPMRSIPARVICLLGMNHDAFPRQDREPGFNLIGLAPRPGDRSRRGDDRYLFLETLISARQALYLSHIGQNIQDNASIPPSVVVDELVEYVTEGFGIPTNRLVTRHPLHGFSPAYFDGSHPELFSYCEENRAAAEQPATDSEEMLFGNPPLPAPAEQWRQCGLDQLSAFCIHPVRFLMEQRLGVFFRMTADTLEDRESFDLNALDRYHYHQQLLKNIQAGVSDHTTYAVARATGQLPHGNVGRVRYRQLGGEVRQFLHVMQDYLPTDRPHSNHLDIDLPPFSVHGTIDQLYTQARIVVRMGKIRPKDLLEVFLRHIAMQMLPGQSFPATSILVGREEALQWGPMDPKSAAAMLGVYLDLYWQGIQHPLPFFCNSSYVYAHQRLIKEKSKKAALAAAFSTWSGTAYTDGEAADPYLNRCFARQNPLTEDFETLALAVFEPI